MRVVVDTNVLVSGIFFTGPPYSILNALRQGKIELVLSDEIFSEYHRVAENLAKQFSEIELAPLLKLILTNSTVVESAHLENPVCEDADDDKFIACAIASNAQLIISGDKHLLNVSGYRDITVMKPRDFVDKHLK